MFRALSMFMFNYEPNCTRHSQRSHDLSLSLSCSTGFEDVTILFLLVKLGLGFNNASFIIKLPLYVAYMTDPSSVDGNQTT